MNLIAIEASTEMLSLGACRGRDVVTVDLPGGAKASSTLLPTLSELMDRVGLHHESLDAVVWGRGPGAFTGLRTACAVAQGIGFAKNIPLIGVDTLAACVQEASHHVSHLGRWLVLLDARMNEVYAARYGNGAWREPGAGGFELLKPEAVKIEPGECVCGNAMDVYASLQKHGGVSVQALPTARALLELAPAYWAAQQVCRAEDALPLYIRDKVAQTTEERLQRGGNP